MYIGSTLHASYLHVNTPSSSSTSQESSSKNSDEKTKKTSETANTLSSSDQALVLKLQAIDTKVHAHENAHIAAGGGVIQGGAVYTYQKAPDNRLYAVAGEVGIDTSEGNNPEETITKMQTVKAAALAPMDPSSTDYQVASTASMLEMQARLELSRLKQAELLSKPKESYTAANNEENEPLFSNYA